MKLHEASIQDLQRLREELNTDLGLDMPSWSGDCEPKDLDDEMPEHDETVEWEYIRSAIKKLRDGSGVLLRAYLMWKAHGNQKGDTEEEEEEENVFGFDEEFYNDKLFEVPDVNEEEEEQQDASKDDGDGEWLAEVKKQVPSDIVMDVSWMLRLGDLCCILEVR
jgi:hypothetical protein